MTGLHFLEWVCFDICKNIVSRNIYMCHDSKKLLAKNGHIDCITKVLLYLLNINMFFISCIPVLVDIIADI